MNIPLIFPGKNNSLSALFKKIYISKNMYKKQTDLKDIVLIL